MGRGDQEILFLTPTAPTQTATIVKRSPAATPIIRFALAGAFFTCLWIAWGQTPKPATDSSTRAAAAPPATQGFSFPYREGGGVVFRFSGTQYRPLGLTELLVDQFTLETFKTNSGLAEWIATAPQCIVSTTGREIHSPGSLKLRQADGQFTIEGQGFHWSHGSQRLVISNHVHVSFSSTLFPVMSESGSKP